ncbi:MAG TPA: DUF4011 domain-containing protein, partial [Candidatus Bathyarchaeia archaeon]|nr:DUF4011 domain-containing protein [Candidatus Bathyarchaeia archaeon]
MSRNSASTFDQENGDSKVFEYIKEWKSRLIDLSRRNRLLYFKQTRYGNLSVSSPTVESVFGRLVNRKRSLEFWLPPDEQVNLQTKKIIPSLSFPEQPARPTPSQLVCEGVTRKDLERMLKKLHRRSLSDYRERGVRILHAAFGMLVWREIESNEEIRSPIVIVPIELSKKSVWEPFIVSSPPVEETAIVNPALQVKLKVDYRIELPPFPENGENRSIADYFTSIGQVVEKFGWKIEPTLEIGLFSFHKLVIYKDLEANAETIIRHPIIRAIAGVKDAPIVLDSLPEERDVDRIENPEKTFRVLDADSSQRISIDYALQGQSFVMQGPPGTGKSQTIANLISECIARGKSVVFVSDKMAALDVVYKRLNDVGLAPFCLELHSSKANKQEVVAELMRCLNEQLIPRKLPSAHEFEKLKDLQAALNGYVSSLHSKHPSLQMSPYDVLCELSSSEHVPSIPVGLANMESLTPQRMRELENLVSELSGVWQVMEEKDFPWQGYRGNSYTLEVRSEVSIFLENIISQMNSLIQEAAEFSKKLGLPEPPTFAQVQWLIELNRLLKESPRPEANWVTHPDVFELVTETQAYLHMFEWRQTIRTRLADSYHESFFRLSLNKSAEIEYALKPVNEILLPSSTEVGELLKKRQELSQFVTSIYELNKKWTNLSKELAQQFGLSAEYLTVERVGQLARIAVLCFSGNKPDAAWFDPAFFRRVQEIVPRAKKDFQEYSSLRNKIEKTYNDKIYGLDLDELVRRYRGPNQGLIRWFHASYYRDRDQIARTTHDGEVPKTVLQDLIDARRAKTLQAEINSYTDMLQGLLGHFYEGPNTDFVKVEEAVESTKEILQLVGSVEIPDNLAKLASHGTSPPQQVRLKGIELRESVDEWCEKMGRLSSIIPAASLPNSKLPIYKTLLNELREWADKTEKDLVLLFSATNDVAETFKQEPSNYRQLVNDLKDAESVTKKETEFLAGRTILKDKFGSRFREFNTDWKEILAVLEWTKKIHVLFGSTKIPELFVSAVSGGAEKTPSNDKLNTCLNSTLDSLSALESRFEAETTYQGHKLHQATMESALNKAVTLRNRVDDLRIWIDFKDVKDRFSLTGMAPFFIGLAEKPLSAAQLVDVFRKGAYQEWINNLYIEDDRLGQFRRENHEKKIADFGKIDRELIRVSSNRAIDAANNRKPQDILIQAEDSEIGVLLKESAKKRRLMPIRSLLQRIPNLLPRLKPCMLMSPISVSQFLQPEIMKYDLILYDEASQIVPEDA